MGIKRMARMKQEGMTKNKKAGRRKSERQWKMNGDA